MGEKTLMFSVNGEFITGLAREQLYYEGRAKYAMDLLLSCMAGTDMPEYQLREMAFSILDGYAEISGTYPGNDYGYNRLEKKDSKWDILAHIEKLANEKKRIQEELDTMTQRCCLAMEKLSDWEVRDVRRAMGDEEPDEELDDVPMSGMLESFMKRWTDDEEHSTEDYGWLAPDGSFYEVDWGNHQEWAQRYIEESYPDEAKNGDIDMQDKCNVGLIGAGDWLVERGWVLLHSPSQGIARPTRNPLKRYTKAQQEFLYDYYMQRNCHKEANAVYEEDD